MVSSAAETRVVEERRRGISLRRQLTLLTPLVVAWGIALVGLAIAGLQSAVPLERLFLDPAFLAGAPWYTGLISSLGVLAWTVALVTAAGGSWVAFQTERASAGRFLGFAAAVAGTFLIDDLFQLHSTLIPELTSLPKTFAIGFVCLPAFVWIAAFPDEVRRTRWLVLAFAGLGLAASAGIDFVFDPRGATALLLEDGTKFLGVIAFAVYNTLTAIDIARSTIRVATRRAAAAGNATPEDSGDVDTRHGTSEVRNAAAR